VRKGLSAALFVSCLLSGVAVGTRAESGVETKSFVVQPGDTLTVSNDRGKVQVRAWNESSIEIRIRKPGGDPAGKSIPEVTTRKDGTTISIQVTFPGPAGSVDLEIKCPPFLNLTITGASPQIDVAGIRGVVRAQSGSGPIVGGDLVSATSLTTESGAITFRANVQPQGDIRLESTSGNLYCEIEDGFNLRSWIRAGGTISWDMDPALRAAALEKQLGANGPLLYAASLKGDVVVRVKPGARPAAPAASQAALPAVPMSDTTAPEQEKPKPTGIQPGSADTGIAKSAREPRRKDPEVVQDASGTRNVPAPSQPSAAQETRRAPARPDGQAPVVVQGGFALKVDVDSVFLNVSVRDRSTNRSMPGLGLRDFRVYEDGVEQHVDQLLPTEAPFNLLLLLDVSGSTHSYIHLMKQAAIDFTHQINANDRVAVATFNSGVRLEQNFTNDRAAAEHAIQGIKSGGGTAFYDALMTCLNRYMRGVEGRSAIVVFTDGVDNQLDGHASTGSRTTFDELYRRVQETDTIIYTIFLDTEEEVTSTMRRPTGRMPGGIGGWPGGRRGGFPGGFPIPYPSPQPSPAPYPRRQQVDPRAVYAEARQQLSDIAEQTGGRMYSPHKTSELSGVYSQIADDLRIQYLLAYNSTNQAHDGNWREIRVAVDQHPEAVVRTRKGYYARKEDVRSDQ
jgi:VWFA-related protein